MKERLIELIDIMTENEIIYAYTFLSKLFERNNNNYLA